MDIIELVDNGDSVEMSAYLIEKITKAIEGGTKLQCEHDYSESTRCTNMNTVSINHRKGTFIYFCPEHLGDMYDMFSYHRYGGNKKLQYPYLSIAHHDYSHIVLSSGFDVYMQI